MDTISWKDLIESSYEYVNQYGVPEDMYTDPAEMEPDYLEGLSSVG